MKNIIKAGEKVIDLKVMSRSELEQMVMNLTTDNESKNQELEWYKNLIMKQQKKLFGKSSEKTSIHQISLFDEAEVEATSEADIEETVVKKKKGKHHKGFKDVTTTRIDYKLSAEELVCPTCEGKLHQMSVEVHKELILIPARIEIKEHARHVYSCRNCEATGTQATIVKADTPKALIKGSYVSASLLAHILSDKYERALPLYRQEVDFKRKGLEISRQTMSNWIIASSERYFQPIVKYMREDLVERCKYIGADETPVDVLHDPRKEEGATNSYMWVYGSGTSEELKMVVFKHEPTRRQENPQTFLKGYKGILQTDGYAGYNNIPEVVQVGCWAHARRYIRECVDLIPSTTKQADTLSYKCLTLINKLFQIEKKTCQNKSYEEIKEIRNSKSRVVVDELYEIVHQVQLDALTKSPLKKALTYLVNQEEKLKAYLEDGRIVISNNRIENAIRPFAIGRKNWLFSNSVKGAESSAAIYSIIESAKQNGLKPYDYLNYILEILPNINITDRSEMDSLLPYSKTLPQELYTAP